MYINQPYPYVALISFWENMATTPFSRVSQICTNKFEKFWHTRGNRAMTTDEILSYVDSVLVEAREKPLEEIAVTFFACVYTVYRYVSLGSLTLAVWCYQFDLSVPHLGRPITSDELRQVCQDRIVCGGVSDQTLIDRISWVSLSGFFHTLRSEMMHGAAHSQGFELLCETCSGRAFRGLLLGGSTCMYIFCVLRYSRDAQFVSIYVIANAIGDEGMKVIAERLPKLIAFNAMGEWVCHDARLFYRQ